VGECENRKIHRLYGCILFSPTPADQRRSTDSAGISKFVWCDSVTNLVLRAAAPAYPTPFETTRLTAYAVLTRKFSVVGSIGADLTTPCISTFFQSLFCANWVDISLRRAGPTCPKPPHEVASKAGCAPPQPAILAEVERAIRRSSLFPTNGPRKSPLPKRPWTILSRGEASRLKVASVSSRILAAISNSGSEPSHRSSRARKKMLRQTLNRLPNCFRCDT
jgi:hypothetical protein